MSDEIWYAGVDGGGTRTEVLMVPADSASGKEPGWRDESNVVRFRLGSINVNGVGRAAAATNMAEAFRRMKEQAKGNLRVCVGTAGLSNPEQREMVLGCARQAGLPESAVMITGDQDIALSGAFAGGDGILIISGTGSICYGQKNGHRYRCGGYGHLLDDEGSGYAIGRDILHEVIRIYDGRAEDSVLRTLVVNRLGTILDDERILRHAQSVGTETQYADDAEYTMQELIHYIYDPTHGKAVIADFARLLDTALDAGDAAAEHIARTAAGSLEQLIETVARKMQDAVGDTKSRTVVQDRTVIAGRPMIRCSCGGSVLKKSTHMARYLQDACSLRVLPIQFTDPEYDAVEGATLMAQTKTENPVA